MFIVPLGLEAKTIQTPWVTFVLVVVISFLSILNRGLSDQLYEIYLHSSERLAYQRELKGFLDESCKDHLRARICDQFQRNVLPEHLMSVEVFQAMRPAMIERDAKELFAFVRPWLEEDNVPKFENNHPRLTAVLEKLSALKGRLSGFLTENAVLASGHLSIWALAKSQFVHSGVFHLLGNLVFLLLLAFPVEQRLGPLRYLSVYFLAGFAGMTLQTLVGDSSVMIVGASANIFGVAGAFLALFAHQRMRILVSFFLLNQQVVVLPVIAYFSFWIVGEEILGLVRSSPDGIAHYAHLGGFVAGYLGTRLVDRFPSLPKAYTYPYERNFQIQLEKSSTDIERLGIFNHWLNVNPASRLAARGALEVAARLHQNRSDSSILRQFREHLWPDLFERHMGESDVISIVPVEWLESLKTHIDAPQLARVLQAHHRQKNYWCEWLILFQTLRNQSIQVPREWEKRLFDLTQIVSREERSLARLRSAAQQSVEIKKFLETMGLRFSEGRGDHAS